MRKWLALALLTLPLGLLAADAPWYPGSIEQALTQAKWEGKPLFLKFYGDW
jgi:hypothetical protein